MAKIIAWIKSHLTLVICSSLGVVSIVVLVLGYIMPTAQADLQADLQVYTNLQGVAGKAANERVVEDLRKQEQEVRRSVQKFLAEATKTNPHSLLNNDIFPEVREPFAPNVFREKCDQKRRELLAMLNAKDKPSQQDIDDYNTELLKAEQKKNLREGRAPVMLNAPAFSPRGSSPALGSRSTVGLDKLTPEELVKQDAHSGASVKRAHEIYCYASNESLDPRNQITDRSAPVELMWESQLSLWIQEDIIRALARLNNDAAKALPEADRWVGNMPVKHLVYITVGSYLPRSQGMGQSSGGAPAVDVSSPAPPPAAADAVFTERGASEQREVVHLAIGLVIDAAELVRVTDEISRIGFYTPLSVSYEAVDPNPYFQDYVYGSGPVIRVRLEYEYCILPQKFEVDKKKLVDIMPADIKSGTYISDSNRSGGNMQQGGGMPVFRPSPGMNTGRRGGGRRGGL